MAVLMQAIEVVALRGYTSGFPENQTGTLLMFHDTEKRATDSKSR
jgi:hypothetical protein